MLPFCVFEAVTTFSLLVKRPLDLACLALPVPGQAAVSCHVLPVAEGTCGPCLHSQHPELLNGAFGYI